MIIKKLALSIPISLALFAISSNIALASLVQVRRDGEVVLSVLSSSDSLALEIPKKESLLISDIAVSDVPNHALISLNQIDGKISLNVASSEGNKTLDVSDYKDSVIEIEERDKAEKVQIGVLDGKFSIEQRGVKAVTAYPISINPKSAEITVTAPSGVRFLAVLPFEAYQGLVKARIISKLAGPNLTIEEGERGELSYLIPGQKVINVFNLFELPVDVSTKVSATTGELLLVEEPIWLKVLGFAFI